MKSIKSIKSGSISVYKELKVAVSYVVSAPRFEYSICQDSRLFSIGIDSVSLRRLTEYASEPVFLSTTIKGACFARGDNEALSQRGAAMSTARQPGPLP